MGVSQLWPVLQPCARPTKLETLNRKRLAVDASIWIYQFLKAVRDKEGNALRNSHVVGFFRRICKLLFFGIKPVFVFDGGAPALKRQTVLGRKRRREGRRDDAARTAGKLLAMQMQRRAEEAEDKRKREIEVRGRPTELEEEEELPGDQNLVYVDEIGMSNQERQQSRKFVKKDAYHLPDLNGGIENMGQPNDPRIMSVEELQEFARQHNSGENIDVYDFSKIDFNGEFFRSLPAVDRYNILNAARLRSRLRMGLSKEQLEELFPDRMAFSKFQVERVRERNELTQRLMNLNGMNGEDVMFGVGSGRIAGERGREYILVKNEGVEGGWALGVVSKDKERGERNKPIDIDALHERAKAEQKDEESEDDEEFEDVPVEGLNRLPRMRRGLPEQVEHISMSQEQERHQMDSAEVPDTTDSLFVEQNSTAGLFEESEYIDEEEELNRAIAMSLEKSFTTIEREEEDMNFEDVPIPSYEQYSVESPQLFLTSGGKGVAHIVNNRSNAAVSKPRIAIEKSDDDENLQDILAAARKDKSASRAPRKNQPSPVLHNIRNPFDGPLPFERLDLKGSIFNKSLNDELNGNKYSGDGEDLTAGGFERESKEESRPLPPWLAGTGDIRFHVKEQRARDQQINAEDYERRVEEDTMYRRDHGAVEVDSSEEGSDIEILDSPPPKKVISTIDLTDYSEVISDTVLTTETEKLNQHAIEDTMTMPRGSGGVERETNLEAPEYVAENGANRADEFLEEEFVEWSESDREEAPKKDQKEEKNKALSIETVQNVPDSSSGLLSEDGTSLPVHSASPSPAFEDVEMHGTIGRSPSQLAPPQEESFAARADAAFDRQAADVAFDDFDEFSDPEDEELLVQLALEAEEHARFASTLNNKSAQQNQEDYERELKQLRNQQKKDRRDADEVSHTMITECQALLRLFGLPYITAPMEAEAQCAELVNLGLVDGVVTDDSDIFLFGGTRVYKNMFNSNKFVECYLSSDLEKELSLSRDKLIEFAHLLGSDYTEGLPGIGPVAALEIISEFPSADGLQEFRDWWFDVQHNNRPKEADSKSPFRKKFRRTQATKLFLPPGFPSPAVTEAYLKPDVDSTPEPFQWGVPDLDNLRSFLMATIGWTQERTDEVLVPVIKDMNRREAQGTQSNITRYFEGAIGAGARESSGRTGVNKGKGSVRMKEAMRKLKARTAVGSMSTTFADEAADWARKNELREAAQQAKQKNKRQARKRPLSEDKGEDDDDEAAEESNVDVDRSLTERNRTGKGKGTGKAKRSKLAA